MIDNINILKKNSGKLFVSITNEEEPIQYEGKTPSWATKAVLYVRLLRVKGRRCAFAPPPPGEYCQKANLLNEGDTKIKNLLEAGEFICREGKKVVWGDLCCERRVRISIQRSESDIPGILEHPHNH